MQEVSYNTKITPDIAPQTNLGTTTDTQEQKKDLPPILSRTANLTVSHAPMDLEALVSKLNLEKKDARDTSAKKTLQSTFTTVIARAKERGTVTTRNIEPLEQAENYSKQLDTTNKTIDTLSNQISQLKNIVTSDENEVAQIQKQVNSLSEEVANLQKQIQNSDAQCVILQMEIDSLTAQIENEVDAQKQTNLKHRLATEQKKLETEKQDQRDRLDKLETNQDTLAKAQAKLDTAKANLATSNSTLSDAENVLATANDAKTELNQKIQDTLSKITDESIIRDIADALKINASDVKSFIADGKMERSEEEEKYLEEHSPVQILQDALSAHYQEILDTIAAKRENIV